MRVSTTGYRGSLGSVPARWWRTGLALGLMAGCTSGDPPPSDDLSGAATLALANAPSDVSCIRVTVVGSRTVVRSFDPATIQGGDQPLLLSGLPLGPCSFSADAFPVACAGIGEAAPTWASDSVSVTLERGIRAEVSLKLRRVEGQASVSIGFEDDGSDTPPPFLFTTACPVTIDSTAATAATFDDVTEHQTNVTAVEVGAFADCPVQRTFARPIASLKVSILQGSTVDDTGYVGDLLVTGEHQDCSGPPDFVVETVDVTSQVTVLGSQASLVLRALETCCCYTGWGYLNEMQGARLRWEVTLAD